MDNDILQGMYIIVHWESIYTIYICMYAYLYVLYIKPIRLIYFCPYNFPDHHGVKDDLLR